jgi:exosortase family protein XrtF
MSFFTLNNKITRFFVYAAALYIPWFFLYELVIKPYTAIDEKLVSVIITQASFILRMMGYTTYQNREDEDMQLMGIDGAHPVWIGSPCNALTLCVFFGLFVLAFPGNAKNKWWFIPLGFLIIHAANLLRVISLVLINYYAPDYLEFNHTYTFTILVYTIIFALWMWWVNFTLKRTSRT